MTGPYTIDCVCNKVRNQFDLGTAIFISDYTTERAGCANEHCMRQVNASPPCPMANLLARTRKSNQHVYDSVPAE